MENHGGTAVTQRLPVHLVDQFLIINSNLVTGLGLHTIIPPSAFVSQINFKITPQLPARLRGCFNLR